MSINCRIILNQEIIWSVNVVPLSGDVLSLQVLWVSQGWRSGVEELGHEFSAGPRLQTQRVCGATWLRKCQLGDQNRQIRQTWNPECVYVCVQYGVTNVQPMALKRSLFIWSPHTSLFTHVRVAFNLVQLLIIINKCQQWQRKAPDEVTGIMTQLSTAVHFHYERAQSTGIVRMEI